MSSPALGPIDTREGFIQHLDYVCSKSWDALSREHPQQPPPPEWTDLLSQWKTSMEELFQQLPTSIRGVSATLVWRRIEWCLLSLAEKGDELVYLFAPADRGNPAIWNANSYWSAGRIVDRLRSGANIPRWINDSRPNVDTPVRDLFHIEQDFVKRLNTIVSKLRTSGTVDFYGWKQDVRKLKESLDGKAMEWRRLTYLLEYMEDQFDKGRSRVLEVVNERNHVKERWTKVELEKRLNNSKHPIWLHYRPHFASSLEKRRVSSRYGAVMGLRMSQEQALSGGRYI